MTKAMRQFIIEKSKDPNIGLCWIVGDASPEDFVEFGIRAFVAEVRKRAGQFALADSAGVPHDPSSVSYGDAFDELSQELLGEK